MTPLEPRGLNGGAGLVATALVQNISNLAPEYTFTLLTADVSHGELAGLDAPNVERRCVVRRGTVGTVARRLVNRLVPPSARVRLGRAYASIRTAGVARDVSPDLLFCPFTV